MLTHTSVRNYQCPLCNLCFKRPTHLTAHYKSRTHEDQPEKIAELLKQGNKKNVVGPVVIPQKYKFKDHHMWAKGRRRTYTRKATAAGETQAPATSNSDQGDTETPPPAETSESSDALNSEPPRQHPHLFQVPGPSVQSYSGSALFSTVNVPQFYGYPNYPNF